MRFSSLTLGLLLSSTGLFAQTNVDQMVQERMAQGGGMRMEDDNDPFVPNTFIGSFRMEMHHVKDGVEQKEATDLLYWSSADRTLNQVKTPSMNGRTMKMLTDLKGKWSYTLITDDNGKRMALKSHKKKIVHTADKDDAKKPEVTVTKETKVIEGHTCTKVIVKSEDGTWTGWVTKDIAVPFGDLMRSMRAGRSTTGDLEAIEGFPLEYEWVNADGTDKMVVYVKDLVVGPVNEDVFSLDGYEVKELPSYGR